VLDVTILRFSGTQKRDPAIADWFRRQPEPFQTMALEWFDSMRGAGRDVEELLHDGYPIVCIDEAPFAYVNAYRDHVNVGFYYGALLDDPAHLLEGTGRRGRHVKLRPGREIDAVALRDLVAAAYADIKLRVLEYPHP
jgi:hypothetical protein